MIAGITMTTFYRRRMLSIDRRSGLQVGAEAAQGRAPREMPRVDFDHAPIETIQVLIEAAVLVGLVALCTTGLVAFALQVL